MNITQLMITVNDEQEKYKSRRGVQLILIQKILGVDRFEALWASSQKDYNNYSRTYPDYKRRTQLGCFFRKLKDQNIFNAEQLTAFDAAARKIVNLLNGNMIDKAQTEILLWNKNLEFGDVDNHMRQLLKEFRKDKKARKQYRLKKRTSRSSKRYYNLKRLTYS